MSNKFSGVTDTAGRGGGSDFTWKNCCTNLVSTQHPEESPKPRELPCFEPTTVLHCLAWQLYSYWRVRADVCRDTIGDRL